MTNRLSSLVRQGEPATFPLNRVIPGWTAGVQLMVEGEARRPWIPVELACKGREGRPKGMLVFDIELIEIDPPATAGSTRSLLAPLGRRLGWSCSRPDAGPWRKEEGERGKAETLLVQLPKGV